ncbi:hypothetical protein DUNSADRAFT_10799 [Dunaliella salina]|uniref:Cap-specific mRNA (nucleoside-2'-O-)-methyltransferase 1 n=1 Tax=Dunaliella salina TaxID=3046 RepID=A0ABQ7H9U3_DUNSA|nr:hypothetical protein DUNSADRAFT_10799 [Dunaliella salina]|eukprot:KAF5843624.1 hypothetical protein DUNSADRAFT_10799 [Dunaliella salina]
MYDKQWLQINREQLRDGRFAKDWKQTTEEGRMVMKERYKFIMQEVDLACDNFIRRYNIPNPDGEKPRFQFMDVCCCPGGFSEYFLLTVPHARGVGLSLPIELGGHILAENTMNRKTGASEPSVLVKDKQRYTIYFQDITTVASSLTAADLWQPGVNALNGVDKTTPAGHQALLAAQLAIMAANLQDGGQMVLRMSMKWTHFTNGVLVLLRRIFRGNVQNFKPRSCHQKEISYYLVCSDFDLALATQLKVYYLPVWLFRRLVEDAMGYKMPPLQFTKHSPCWRFLTFGDQPGRGCRMGIACELAHNKLELHPYTKVAFNQVNGHLYKPAVLDPRDPRFGMLRPGEGHPRNEEKEVERQIVEWVLYAIGEPMLPGVSNPAFYMSPMHPAHNQLNMLLRLHAMKMAEQIWHHMLSTMHTAFLGNFSKSAVLQASDPLALTNFKNKFNTNSVAHVLSGPDAQPVPVQAPLVPPLGMNPLVMHTHGGDVFGVGAHGVMGMGVQGSIQGGMGPETQFGGVSGMAGLEGGSQGEGDTVIEGGYSFGEDQGVLDTFGTEVFQGAEDDIDAMKLSGYSMPLVAVQVADEYSHNALLQYLGE